MPTNYNFRNTPNYWDLTLPDVAPGGPRLKRLLEINAAGAGGFPWSLSSNSTIPSGTMSIDYSQLSPLGRYPLKFTSTGTESVSSFYEPFGNPVLPISIVPPNSTDFYYAKLWFKTDSPSNSVFCNLIFNAGGSGGGLSNVAANTWFTVYGDRQGVLGQLEKAQMRITINTLTVGQNYWFDFEYIKRQSRTGANPNYVYTDLDPTTTTSFDDQFIPADTFRQGNLYAWGQNDFSAQSYFNSGLGVLPDGSTSKSSPILVNSYSSWKLLNDGSGGSQRYAIDSNGYLWFWGLSNSTPVAWPVRSNTQLRTVFSTPALSSSNEKWISVSRHGNLLESGGLSIRTDGTLWTWGLNSYGQLGNNTTTNSQTLIQEFTSDTNWKKVAGGRYHVAAIKSDGTLWTWGRNNRGQLGVNDTLTRSTPVQEFTSSTNWKQVNCTENWTVAIKNDGTMWKWGGILSGVNYFSGGDAYMTRSTPTQEQLLRTDWKSLYCSYTSGLGVDIGVALTKSGVAYRFGFVPSLNNGGGPAESIVVFAQNANRVWKTASTVGGNYFLIDTTSNLWAMGINAGGSLGINDDIFRPTPVQVTQANGWKQVTSGKFTNNINHGIRHIDPII